MIVPSALRTKLDFEGRYVKIASESVRDIVRAYCDLRGFAYMGRLKSAESLAEKIETGRFEKWSDLDDLFACTIIIPTLSVEPEVIDFFA